MKFSIYLKHNFRYTELFKLGHTSDGGFFVQDLLSGGGKYLINKMSVPSQRKRGFGASNVAMKKGKYWTATKSPKLTHHIDGLVQVSGEGIPSGFYNFFSGHKGISTQSMNLTKRNNDGGPIFTFFTRNLPETGYEVKHSIVIDKYEQVIDPYKSPKSNEDCAFSIEFYYFPKEILNNVNLENGTISFRHPSYGIVPLKYVPAPGHAPGLICMMTLVFTKGNDNGQFSFSLGGGASADLKNGEFEHLFIIYPHVDEMVGNQKIRNLDFKGWNKLKAQVDYMMSEIKK